MIYYAVFFSIKLAGKITDNIRKHKIKIQINYNLRNSLNSQLGVGIRSYIVPSERARILKNIAISIY